MWLYNLSRRLAFLEELFSEDAIEVTWDSHEIECTKENRVVARVSADYFWIDVASLNQDKKGQIVEAVKSGRFENLEME